MNYKIISLVAAKDLEHLSELCLSISDVLVDKGLANTPENDNSDLLSLVCVQPIDAETSDDLAIVVEDIVETSTALVIPVEEKNDSGNDGEG